MLVTPHQLCLLPAGVAISGCWTASPQYSGSDWGAQSAELAQGGGFCVSAQGGRNQCVRPLQSWPFSKRNVSFSLPYPGESSTKKHSIKLSPVREYPTFFVQVFARGWFVTIWVSVMPTATQVESRGGLSDAAIYPSTCADPQDSDGGSVVVPQAGLCRLIMPHGSPSSSGRNVHRTKTCHQQMPHCGLEKRAI